MTGHVAELKKHEAGMKALWQHQVSDAAARISGRNGLMNDGQRRKRGFALVTVFGPSFRGTYIQPDSLSPIDRQFSVRGERLR
jgi:hypothetical protein